MSTSPVLRPPDFTKTFVEKIDACGVGMGVVLIQERQTIAHLSKALSTKNLGMSVYEKELLAVMMAVMKWKQFLLIKMTPFEACYGYKPLQLPLGTLCNSIVPSASQLVHDKKGIMQLLKYHLSKAQHKMKENANKHRTEREFNVGDRVYIKLQPYRQKSVAVRRSLKLSSKFFGPFPIIARVG